MKKKVEIKDSGIYGFGVFAAENISTGEIIHVMEEPFPKYSIQEIKSWPEETRENFLAYAFLGEKDYYYGSPNILAPDASFLMNHSCNPNCWYIDDITLAASKNITIGEEITIDYATVMCPSGIENSEMICHCGARNCRGSISKMDCISSSVFNKYKGHFLSVIEKEARKYQVSESHLPAEEA